MNVHELVKTSAFKRTVFAVVAIIVLAIVFSIGVALGFHKSGREGFENERGFQFGRMRGRMFQQNERYRGSAQFQQFQMMRGGFQGGQVVPQTAPTPATAPVAATSTTK